ncbi:MAG: hypothetical protein GXY92_08900 [Syntrophomonadaceae bacterium]|nr:hypothetical protein [Syntrophomonadaceae bacterium]
MSLEMVRALYHDILKKILLLEIEKKSTSRRILIQKSERERLPLIRDFLQADLSKHRLLEKVAVSAVQNRVDEVLDHISQFYPSSEGLSQIECIRIESARCEQMLVLICKEIKHPETCTFFERRVLSDIKKYVIDQAREYARVNL